EVHNAGDHVVGHAAPRLVERVARRRMSDYVVAGLSLAPADSTFVEARDATLAAAAASDPDAAVAMAAGFATRGAGRCAAAPPRLVDRVARRRMSDYVVAGLSLAPADSTFVEARDAILAAAAASDPDDAVAMAAGFATRGAGSCAVSPPRSSTDFVGVVEDFAVSPRLALGEITLEVVGDVCDGDGLLDGE